MKCSFEDYILYSLKEGLKDLLDFIKENKWVIKLFLLFILNYLIWILVLSNYFEVLSLGDNVTLYSGCIILSLISLIVELLIILLFLVLGDSYRVYCEKVSRGEIS